jgi:Mg-chelatase subunit ChlD
VVTDGRATAGAGAAGHGVAGRRRAEPSTSSDGTGAALRPAGRAAGGDPVAEARAAARLLAATGVASVVVDCESGPIRLGLAAALAVDLAGVAVRLDELSADGLSGLVRDVRGAA